MRTNRFWIPAASALLAVVASGCLVVPQIKDKVIDLVTGSEVIAPFTTFGSTDIFTQTATVDLRDFLDIAGILDNAGIDVSDVKSITVSGVSYRIIRAEAGRTITSGDVLVGVSGAAPTDTLIADFSGSAAAVTDWIYPRLGVAGVTQLNDLLAGIVHELKTGTPVDQRVSYTVHGVSTPVGVDTNFDYEIRLTVSIVGTVKTKWLE
ncbi:MAG TPA: hypothetical protein VMS88_01155 [Terriglobales bacterium]|nr:hypothetical protein [Terriglobales bacterium]